MEDEIIYIHPEEGEISASRASLLAEFEGLTLEQYIQSGAVSLKQSEEPVGTGTVLRNEEVDLDSFYDPSKKVPVVAAEDAGVATEIDETSALEFKLEDTLLELEKARKEEKKLSTFESRNKYAIARQNYKNASKELEKNLLNTSK